MHVRWRSRCSSPSSTRSATTYGVAPSSVADLYVVKRDGAGNPTWTAHLGSPRNSQALGITADVEDHAIVLWATVDPQSLSGDQLELVKFAP